MHDVGIPTEVTAIFHEHDVYSTPDEVHMMIAEHLGVQQVDFQSVGAVHASQKTSGSRQRAAIMSWSRHDGIVITLCAATPVLTSCQERNRLQDNGDILVPDITYGINPMKKELPS